jgi:glutamate/tyrosine decarboxylase-like PLP-dependent enzyme
MAFDFNTWPGGRMITPTLAGTRPGGAISAAWAVMQHLGFEGYERLQGRVLEARRRIQDAVERRGWRVLGDPRLGLIAFTRDDVNVYAVWRALSRRGWFSSVTTEPPSIHLMLSPEHDATIDAYLADLDAALAQAAQEQRAKGPKGSDDGEAVRYSG